MSDDRELLEISVNLTREIVTITDPDQSPQYAEMGTPVEIHLSLEELELIVRAYEILTAKADKNGG